MVILTGSPSLNQNACLEGVMLAVALRVHPVIYCVNYWPLVASDKSYFLFGVNSELKTLRIPVQGFSSDFSSLGQRAQPLMLVLSSDIVCNTHPGQPMQYSNVLHCFVRFA